MYKLGVNLQLFAQFDVLTHTVFQIGKSVNKTTAKMRRTVVILCGLNYACTLIRVEQLEHILNGRGLNIFSSGSRRNETFILFVKFEVTWYFKNECECFIGVSKQEKTDDTRP